jgi:hypothetical protein
MTVRPLAEASDAQLLATLRASLADAPESELLRVAALLDPADPMPAAVIDSCRAQTRRAVS